MRHWPTSIRGRGILPLCSDWCIAAPTLGTPVTLSFHTESACRSGVADPMAPTGSQSVRVGELATTWSWQSCRLGGGRVL